MNETIKNKLLILSLCIITFLMIRSETNRKDREDIFAFWSDVENCLEDQTPEFRQTPLELFEECRDSESNLDDIESCMSDQEIELEQELVEYVKECKDSVKDYYNYQDEMQDIMNEDREPSIR